MLYWLSVLGSLLPGVGFTYLAGAYFQRRHWLRRHGRRTQGRVLRSQVESTGRGGTYFTTIAFGATSGEQIEVELGLGLPFRVFQVGQPVTVYYDPAHPRRCVVASRAEPWGYAALALVGCVGTIFMVWLILTHH